MNNSISASLVSLSLQASTSAMGAVSASADKAAAAMNVDKGSFVKVVTSSNAFAIDSSKLAEQKAKDVDVKEFAKQMIADHTMTGDKLKKAAMHPRCRADAVVQACRHDGNPEGCLGAGLPAALYRHAGLVAYGKRSRYSQPMRRAATMQR